MQFLQSFPARLGAMFLLLVAVAAAGTVLITLRAFELRQIEIDQRLHADVAASMASEIEPLLTGGDGEVGSAMHYMMVMNPSVEIYLLADDGRILDYFAAEGPEVRLDRVSVEPIEAFIEGTGSLPILGDNPRQPGRRHHFSASRIDLGRSAETGYLYVILHSIGYDEAAMGLQRRYLLRALRTSLLITLPLVGALGLIVFFFAARPLRTLTDTVRAFGSGQYDRRSDIDRRDEIGALARDFNAMADTIVSNVRRLEAADRERRELVANISHDLRNPLATIQGYLETLWQRDSRMTSEERASYYEILLSTARSLPRLVDDLFELSKLEAPETPPPMEPFSLSELVQDVAVTWRRRAADRGIELSTPHPDDLYLVYGNVGLVERALTNLVRNAVTHTPSGGSISVSVHGGNRSIRVEVRDTGPGIAPADRERVFERFYIGDASRSKAKDGSGLGLAICKRIVELHGGEVGVDSEEGGGSTFYFELPQPDPNRPEGRQSAPH